MENLGADEQIMCTHGNCGASNSAIKMKPRVICEVNIDIDDEHDIWATVFDDVLKKVIPGKILSTAHVHEVLTGLRDIAVVVDTEHLVVKDISRGATAKNEGSSTTTKKDATTTKKDGVKTTNATGNDGDDPYDGEDDK